LLLKEFGSLEGVSLATVEQLALLEGIGADLAELILASLR